MSGENMPILYTNIMDGLPSGLAKEAFLWAVERPGEDRMCYRAERFALQVHQAAERLRPMLAFSAHQHGMDAPDPSLTAFILRRHANLNFGGNVSPPYCEASK